MNQPLPNTDPDLKLARLLDLKPTGPFGKENAAFMGLLNQYKEVHSLPSSVPASVWEAISRETKPASTPVYRLKTNPRYIIRWAIAALFIITASFGLYKFLDLDLQTPVAEAFESIEIYTTSNGTVITLRPNSRLFINEMNESLHQYRIEGEAWFGVIPEERIFEVITLNGSIRVLGTRFNVKTWGRSESVYLEKGSVQIKNLNSYETGILSPGQIAHLHSDGQIFVAQASHERESGWMNQEMILESTPLRDIRLELEHHFNIRIQLPGELQDETYSGRILLGQKSETMRDIGVVTGGSFRLLNDQSYIFEPIP